MNALFYDLDKFSSIYTLPTKQTAIMIHDIRIDVRNLRLRGLITG